MASNKSEASRQSSNEVFEKNHQFLVSSLKPHLKVVVQEAPEELLRTELKSRLLDENVDPTQRVEELLSEIKKAACTFDLFFQFVVILNSVRLDELANKLQDDYWSQRDNESGQLKCLGDISVQTETSYTNEELWDAPHPETEHQLDTVFSPVPPHYSEPRPASPFSSVAEAPLDAVVSQSSPLSGFTAPLKENKCLAEKDEPVFGQLAYKEKETQLYENLHEAHNELTSTLKRGQGHKEEFEKTRKKYKRKLEEMKNFYQSKYDHITKSLEQECAQHAQDVAQLQEEKQSMKADINDQRKTSEMQRDKIKQQAELLKQKTSEVATLRKKCAAKEKLCAELESKLKQARQEFKELQEEIKQKEQDIKKLTVKRTLQVEELETCLKDCTEMHKLADSLENSLNNDQLTTLSRQLEHKMKKLKTQRRLSNSWPRI